MRAIPSQYQVNDKCNFCTNVKAKQEDCLSTCAWVCAIQRQE